MSCILYLITTISLEDLCRKELKIKLSIKLITNVEIHLKMFTNSFHLTLKSEIDTLQIIGWYNKINKMIAFTLELESTHAQ